MAFSINAFYGTLVDLFINSPLFPNAPKYYFNKLSGEIEEYSEKHPNRKGVKLKQIAQQCMNETKNEEGNVITFDYGNEKMEIDFPYYHILQDAPYIRKKHKGTDKTKGSQAKVERGKRDYNIVSWNGKTFTKEYSRNVRGARNRTSEVSHWATDSKGQRIWINRGSDTYLNEHYQYIDKILDSVVKELADAYGMKLLRKQKTGLAFDYLAQMNQEEDSSALGDFFDAFYSF